MAPKSRIWVVKLLLCVILSCNVKVEAKPETEQETTGVVFPSGEILYPIEEDSLQPQDQRNLEDEKHTGSSIYEVEDYPFPPAVREDTRLSLNFAVRDFWTVKDYYYIRAHPLFMQCLQKVYNFIKQTQQKTVRIVSGYKTHDEIGKSTTIQDVYATTGSAAIIGYEGEGNDVKDLAQAALFICPTLFSLEQRDIGMILMENTLHIHLRGAEDAQPYFAVDGYPGMTDDSFKEWAFSQIDDGIDPRKTPECEDYVGLNNGEVYPAGAASPEAVVGAIDEEVTRDKPEDFKRLVQFLGGKVVFENGEHGAEWCGDEDNPCVACESRYYGNIPSSRCADRLMSPRLYGGIQILQKLVREVYTGDKLKVIEAWDEGYEGNPQGDTPPGSLHFEGRAAKLALAVSNTVDNLKTLSRLAICAGVDYVKHGGDHLLVAVKKQAKIMPHEVDFPGVNNDLVGLLKVTPPSSQKEEYTLPEELPLGNADNYPVFDGALSDTKIGNHATIGTFKSPNKRYFRLDPRLVKCYDSLVDHINKWNVALEKDATVTVSRSYLSNSEQDAVFVPSMDPEGNSYSLGLAMDLVYDPPSSSQDKNDVTHTHEFVKMVIHKCGPIMFDHGVELALGLYPDRLHVHIRQELLVWTEKSSLLPTGMTLKEYTKSLLFWYLEAIDNRIVDPVDPTAACKSLAAPQRRSPDYQYEHTDYIKIMREKRSVSGYDDEECVPKSDTDFCQETVQHRKDEVEEIWTEVLRMHLYRDKEDIRESLQGCFDACGTCVSGHIYEDKTENCDNFLHWSPFDLMNDASDVTNLHYHGNTEMKRHACEGGRHCIDKAPLYAIQAPSMYRLYRPDPKRSMEEELYGPNDNPLPVYELLIDLYAIHANGTLNVWVENEVEVEYLRNPLKVAMLYNKDVTFVDIYVGNASHIDAVELSVEHMCEDWVSTGCPAATRETLAHFEVHEIPAERRKRAAEMGRDLSEELAFKRKNFERVWMQKAWGEL